MLRPPRNAKEAIKRQSSLILAELDQGVPRNSIRRALIRKGLPEVSRSYFNEVVSEILEKSLETKTVIRSATQESHIGEQPTMTTGSSYPNAQGNHPDNRFTGGY